jgi:hypothetical protein
VSDGSGGQTDTANPPILALRVGARGSPKSCAPHGYRLADTGPHPDAGIFSVAAPAPSASSDCARV